jgi:hypothetical protein
MATHFESELSLHDAFYARGDSLRTNFGQWDCCDPIAHVILDLVEAQTELACAFDDVGDAAIRAALKKRSAAAKELMDAINEHEGCRCRFSGADEGAGEL